MMEVVLLVCELFGALVLAVDAAPYFRWGDTRQHVDVWSSSWTNASWYETAGVIQSCVDELAMPGTGPDRSAILRHGETLCCRRRHHGVGACTQVRPFLRRLFLEESFARVFRQWFRCVSERSSVMSM